LVYHGVGANESYVSVTGENGITPAWIVERDAKKDRIMTFLHMISIIQRCRRGTLSPQTRLEKSSLISMNLANGAAK